MFCVHLCLLLASVTTHVVPLNFYFKSYFSLSFKIQQTGSRTEQGVGVMGNDRTGRGKYHSKAHCSWGLWSCCSEAPRLLSSCQLIKAKSLPIPAGIPHQTARGAFYPKQNAASCHSGGSATSCTRTAKFNTAEWKSIPCRGGVAQTREGETVKRSPGKWDLERHSLSETRARKAGSQMMPGRQLMSRFTLSTLCQFWCLTIKAKHLIFVFSTNYCKGYCFSCELGLCVQIPLSRVHLPQQSHNDFLRLISFCFDL